MVNLNYQKVLNYCKKQIDKNPFVAKAILIHVGIVVILYVLSYVSTLRFDSTVRLQAQVSNLPKKMQIIQATSISSTDLNKQIWAYEHHREELRQAHEDVKRARQQAIKVAEQQAKAKAEAERKAKLAAQKKKAQEKAKRKLEQQKKAEQEKKVKLEAERKVKQQAQKKAEDAKRKEKAEKERKAREERLAKARAEAEAAARKQIEQTQAQSAISSYIAKYQERVGQNWIKDSCRGIYTLPRAIIRDGKFIKLTGTSGNFRCDKSLINAIKNTTPPTVSNSVARQTIQNENISFIFRQT